MQWAFFLTYVLEVMFANISTKLYVKKNVMLRGKLVRPTSKQPPYDLTITSKMERCFCDSVTGEAKSRLESVYFHLNLDCVKRKQPYFMTQMATIPRNKCCSAH